MHGEVAPYNEVGLVRISDIYLTQESLFMTFREFCNKFQFIGDILKYQALILNIPRDWKQQLGAHPFGIISPTHWYTKKILLGFQNLYTINTLNKNPPIHSLLRRCGILNYKQKSTQKDGYGFSIDNVMYQIDKTQIFSIQTLKKKAYYKCT